MKLTVCAALALALPVAAQAQWPPRELGPGEKFDKGMGVVIRSSDELAPLEDTESLSEGPRSVSCSISFNPSVIGNQQQSTYGTFYGGSGCVAGNLVETITWNWASNISYYGEFEQQKKQLQITGGCLAASGHAVTSPTGTGINGPTLVFFEIRDWPGNNLICSATTVLTVL